MVFICASGPLVSAPRFTHNMAMDGNLGVSVTVTYTGQRAGAEVDRLYLFDRVGSYIQPDRELKVFRRAEFAPGESRELTVVLTADDLAGHTAKGERVAEPGEFVVYVGSNSADLESATFTLHRGVWGHDPWPR